MTREYAEQFVDLVKAQSGTPALTVADVERAETRAQLGIGSLAVITLLVGYIESSGAKVDFDPAWVPRLERVDGILDTLRDIDAAVPSTA